MTMISAGLVEIGRCFEQQFKPVIVTGEWRVAVLRQCGKVYPHCIQEVERHNETDEVFILTVGKADLILLEERDGQQIPHVIAMELNVAYNVKQSVWHHVVLSADAHIFLFEKADTSTENSDYRTLDAGIQDQIRGKISISDNE
jgi:ureidoglycolate hydrolase